MPSVFKSCRDCSDRYPGCHDKCEKYLGEKAEHSRRMAAEKQRLDGYSYGAGERLIKYRKTREKLSAYKHLRK